MDPATHFLTGACLGRSGFNRKTAYATLAMILAAEAPDIDVLWSIGGPVTGFNHHRAITHTLIGAPFMALAVTAVVWAIVKISRTNRAQPIRWRWIYTLSLIADLSHLLLDYTNNYGLRPFFPFNPHWYAWSIVYIFDPVLFAFLLIGLLIPSLLGLVEGEMRRPQPGALRGRAWAIAALTAIGLLYALRNAEHARAIRLVQQAGTPSGHPLIRVAAEPSMANPFRWKVLAETENQYQVTAVDTLTDNLQPGDTIYKPPVTQFVAAAKQSYLGRVYEGWSSWPITEDLGVSAPPAGDTAPLPPGSHTVLFRDLRYAENVMSLPTALNSRSVLSGEVVVAPDRSILSQWMNDRRQR